MAKVAACLLTPAHALGLVQQHLSLELLLQEKWNLTAVDSVAEAHAAFLASAVAATDRLNVAVIENALKTAFPQFTPKSKQCLG